MEFHEIANIFPMMSEHELSSLAQDIKQNGLQNAITICDGKILDGRNRFEACRIAGVEPEFEAFDGDDPLKAVISLNLMRRHLDESQRAVIASRVANMPAYRPSNKSANMPTLSQPEAAALFNVSERMIRTVKAIEREAPERIPEIESGAMTATKVYRLVKREDAAAKAKHNQELPSGKYRVIYADPPWKYGNTMPEYMGVQDDHYPTMTIGELAGMDIPSMCEKNAVLFIWVTSPILEDAFAVINAWGFKYKASFVWDKVKHVMGHYNSVRHEFLLVCVKGSCQPDVQRLFDSVVTEERKEHSRKPEIFREIISTIYPHGRRIELFARRKTDGWHTFGNELQANIS